MIKNAIILAGGFGTRLQSVVKDLPKPMAPVDERPFLQYLFDYLIRNGTTDAILSVGYKWETIRSYFGDKYASLNLKYSVEDVPLGTGGAILKAVQNSDEEEFFVFNGDTFFAIDLHSFYNHHHEKNSMLSLALKRMTAFDRYGVVVTDEKHVIQSFEEKRYYEKGDINGGIYLLSRKLFDQLSFREKFSFEKDLMEQYCNRLDFYGFVFDDYFIDIGIPEDYSHAQQELPALLAILSTERSTRNQDRSSLFTLHSSYAKASEDKHSPFTIDPSWTLFLDRDGVINKKIDNDYVRNVGQFEWLPGVQDAIKKLSSLFGRIIIVSNQQGVGKGLMTNEDVESVHEHIMESVVKVGGKIDNIYFAPQLKSENSEFRKPNIGMALQAQKDFPDIEFSKSIMVGDSTSDMEFGKKTGMKTVFILNGKPVPSNTELIDACCENLTGLVSRISSRK